MTRTTVTVTMVQKRKDESVKPCRKITMRLTRGLTRVKKQHHDVHESSLSENLVSHLDRRPHHLVGTEISDMVLVWTPNSGSLTEVVLLVCTERVFLGKVCSCFFFQVVDVLMPAQKKSEPK